MEYCNAGDLAEYLQKQGTLSEDTERVYFKRTYRSEPYTVRTSSNITVVYINITVFSRSQKP